MSQRSIPWVAEVPQPARRSLLKRLSGLVAGTFLASPLQAVLGRSPLAAAPLSSGTEPILGEIILVAFNYAPTGYALCDGRILPIAQNTAALFSLLGNTYGGNGSTFGLPDLRGRVPIHHGNSQGPGLSAYPRGLQTGAETVTLTTAQMAAHTHTTANATAELGTQSSPANAYLASNASGQPQYAATSSGAMLPTSSTGDGQPHDEMQPFLTIGFYIALRGIFPSRS